MPMFRKITAALSILTALCVAAGVDVDRPAGARAAFGEEPSQSSVFPERGLRSIFRDDFPFVIKEGEVNKRSVPSTKLDCGVRLLTGGHERLNWRFDLLHRARNAIRVQTYIFSRDKSGRDVAAILKKRRREGLDVKLTIDTYTKFKPSDRRMFNSLELAGIIIMGFEPWYLLGTAENGCMNFRDVNMRFHEKYWVADDVAAIVGGANVADEYFRRGDDPENKWRDQDVLLTGSIVEDIATAFDENQAYFKDRREGRLSFNRATFFREPYWRIKGNRPPPVRESKKEAKTIPAEELDDENVPVRFVRHRPRYGEDYIYQAYLHLIDNARKSIVIENAYFIPNRGLITALMKSAKRGVRVIVITNSDKTNDVSGMQPLCRYSYLPLVKYGVEIYEWRGASGMSGTLHSKFAIFDKRVSVIGSCNLDPRSININSEDVVLIDSSKVAEYLTTFVETRDLRNTRRISIEEALKWHRPIRTAERFRLKFGMTMKSWY